MTTNPIALALAPRRLPATAPHEGEAATWIWPGAPMVLPASVRQTIQCEAGTVWITQGDGEDYILIAGQHLVLQPRDQVIVTAMFAPSVVRRWPRT